MKTPIPCNGCRYYKTRNIPFMGTVHGCINKSIDALKYVKLSTNGGECQARIPA
jgi:hypothetical protein